MKKILDSFVIFLLFFQTLIPNLLLFPKTASADSLDDAVGHLTITPENFLDYFTLNGNASFDSSTGILTLTQNSPMQGGNATFNKKILFNQDVHMDLSVNLGDKPQPDGADGVGIGFHDDTTNAIGQNGNGFGVGGLSGVIGFKLDTYYNSSDEAERDSLKDPPAFSNNQSTPGKGNAFGGFMATNATKQVYTIDDAGSYGASSAPQQINNPSGNAFNDLTIDYKSSTQILSSTYESKNWSMNISNFIKTNSGDVASKSLIFSASTGGSYNLQQIKINKITIAVPLAAIKKVDATEPTKQLAGAVFDIYNSTDTLVAKDLITDSDGYTFLPSTLSEGTYYAVETKAPTGYVLNPAKQSFVLNNSSTTNYVAFTASNERIHGNMVSTKTVSSKTASYGDILTYTINVTNSLSDSFLANILVSDQLPDGLELVAGSLSVDGVPKENEASGNAIKTTIDSIEGNQSVAVSFQAKVTETSSISIANTANVTDPVDPDHPQTPTATVEIHDMPGTLTTAKTVLNSSGETVSNQTVSVGDILTYRISATNSNSDPDSLINNVTISDTLLDSLSYQAGSLQLTDANGSTTTLSDTYFNGQTLTTDNLGSLMSGKTLMITFQVKVLATASGSVTNTATVNASVPSDTPDEGDVNLPPQTPSTSVGVPGEVTGTKLVNNASSATVGVGDTLTYSIKLTHTAGSGQWSGTLSDQLPDGVSYVAGSTEVNGEVVKDADVWKGTQLAIKNVTLSDDKSSLTVTFRVKTTDTSAGTTIINKATATPNKDDTNDPYAPNTPSIAETTTAVAYSAGTLEANKTITNSDGGDIAGKAVSVGNLLTYHITMKNTGSNTTSVNNVILKDILPDALTYQPGTLTLTTADGKVIALSDALFNGQTLTTENLGNLVGGQSFIVSFIVKVLPTASGIVKNTATVDATVPSDIPGNPDVKLTPVTPSVSFGVPGEATGQKLVNGKTSNTAFVGNILTYSILLTHTDGTGQWSGTLSDQLPDGVSYVPGSTTVNGEAVSDATLWEGKQLTINEVELSDDTPTLTVTFQVTVTGGVGTSIANQATATPDNSDTDDPYKPNIPVIPETKTDILYSAGTLETSKAVVNSSGVDAADQPVSIGDSLTYTIVAKNTGDAVTTVNNIIIRDALPDGLTYQRGSLTLTAADGSKKTLSDSYFKEKTLTTENLGSLIGGESLVISFKATVTANANRDVTNTATVDATVPSDIPSDPDLPLDPQKPTVTVQAPTGEVTGTKSVNNEQSNTASVGDTLTYSIVLSHKKGSGQWTGKIVDQLPKGINYQAGSTKINGKSSSDSEIWQGTTLTLSDVILTDDTPTVTVTFKVTVTDDAAGTTIKNKASILPDDPTNSNAPDVPETNTKVKEVTQQAILLKTGEQTSIYLVVIGIFLLKWVAYIKYKKEQSLF